MTRHTPSISITSWRYHWPTFSRISGTGILPAPISLILPIVAREWHVIALHDFCYTRFQTSGTSWLEDLSIARGPLVAHVLLDRHFHYSYRLHKRVTCANVEGVVHRCHLTAFLETHSASSHKNISILRQKSGAWPWIGDVS